MAAQPSLLVTGGSGYLGQRLVRHAQAEWDATATYLTHGPSTAGCRWRKLDIRDQAEVFRLFEQVVPQVVIHTAAVGSGQDLQRVNVDGTRHVALAAAHVSARLIHLSTDVLFDGRQGPYVESAPPSPIAPYGRSKAEAEKLLADLMPQAAVVRTSIIYDFGLFDRQTRWMLETLNQGQPLRLFTDEFRCPIWVETLAIALLELATLDYAGVLHMAGGQALSRYEFGIRLLCFHGIDLSGVVPVRAAGLNLNRPLDCRLDITKATKILDTPLLGVDEAVAQRGLSCVG